FGQQQQTRRLDRVARHADEPRFLPLLAALAVAVDHACDLAIHPMLDAQGPTLDTQIEFASGLGARNLGVERAPLRTRLAALHTEPLLDAEPALVRRARIDGHVVRVHALVADALRTVVHHLEVIRRR